MLNIHFSHDTESNIALAIHIKVSGYLEGALDLFPSDDDQFCHVFSMKSPRMDKQRPAHCSYVSESN